MWIKIVEDGHSNDYENRSKWIASSFLIAGLTMILYLLVSPLQASAILGVALTTIGLFSSYLTAKLNPMTPVSWSKSLLIFFTGMIFLFVGLETLTSMGILVGLFFLFVTLNDIYLAYVTRQNATAYTWGLHGILSGYFALDILMHTSSLTANTIGIYIALNLITDGLVVLYSGRKVFIRP